MAIHSYNNTIHIGGMTFNSFQEMMEYGRTHHPSWYHEASDGSTIKTTNGGIFINGNEIQNAGELLIVVTGNAGNINTTTGNVMVAGQVNSIQTASGDIRCNVVQGDASTMSGDVIAQTICGNASTMSGDIIYR